MLHHFYQLYDQFKQKEKSYQYIDLFVGGINLFTMQSASVYSVTTNFALAVDSVRTPNDMSPLMKADRSFFQLTTPAPPSTPASIKNSL